MVSKIGLLAGLAGAVVVINRARASPPPSNGLGAAGYGTVPLTSGTAAPTADAGDPFVQLSSSHPDQPMRLFG